MHTANILVGYLNVYFIIFRENLSEAQTCQKSRDYYFQIIKEKWISTRLPTSGSKLISYSTDKNRCVSYCLKYSSCKSANFRISTGECSLFGKNSWEDEFNIVSDSDNIIVQKMGEPAVSHGDWTLVFRGLANINKFVYNAYTNTSLGHDQPLSPMYPIGCLRLDTNLSCNQHFRSNILNSWSNLNITEVKFSIYKDGVMQKYLLFNGSSTTRTSWFSKAKLMNTSWTDLPTSSVLSFSVDGVSSSLATRRFYVEHSHNGCYTDSGWFASIDFNTTGCAAWGLVSPFPQFLYAPGNTRFNNVNMTKAEIIAIFVKF